LPEPEASSAPSAAPAAAQRTGSARIGMRSGFGFQRDKAANEKRAEAQRRVSRATWRSVAIGVGAGVALYVVARLLIYAR
jgi:hypothetical protein